MDKNAIKKYAVWARRELISRVSQKAQQFGITEKNTMDASADSVGGHLLSADEKKQRQALIARIRQKGYEQVMEEVAYTWFNRFIALRFMEVNGYLPTHVRVFTDEQNSFKPQILAEAIHLELDGLNMDKVYALKEANNDEALYKYLLITQCNALSAILPGMFQRIDDYTELLFPDNLLREGSALEQMVTLIPEADWQDQVQIIGWLYQYYNSEPKDKVFADLKKNIKISKENIPAATQLFTPDWIVRYMAENSLGRLWIEGHPNGALKSGWKYYLDEADQEPDVQAQLDKIREEYKSLKPEEIRCIDPCMGSGHIIAYFFDVLMQIYEAYGYRSRDAVQSIVRNNLYGLDIDDRAAQLAYFSVMMKARQYDSRFFTRGVKPNVYAICESNGISSHTVDYFANGDAKRKAAIDTILTEMHDAKEYGSILTVTPQDFAALYARFDEVFDDISMHKDAVLDELLPLVRVAETLAQKYDVVVTNPPYMGSSGMSAKLGEYVKKNYPDSKSDLFAVFMERCGQMTVKNRYQAMITQHAWMFLSSFEKLRGRLLQKDTVNMAHLGARAFEEIGGEVVQTTSFVLRNSHISECKGVYCRLVDYGSQQEKETAFLAHQDLHTAQQENFSKIPGSPIAYWASSLVVDAFFSCVSLAEIAKPRVGLQTSNNERFVRLWYETNYAKIRFGVASGEETKKIGGKWFPHNKGGEFRKWYGNNYHVVDYENDGFNIKAEKAENLRLGLIEKKNSQCWNSEYYFRESLTWSRISSTNFGIRYSPTGFVFDTAGTCIFADTETLKYLLGLLSTKVVSSLLQMINPTLTFQTGDIAKIPVRTEQRYGVVGLVDKAISLSKTDWDSFETSWDFKEHPLIQLKTGAGYGTDMSKWSYSIETAYKNWEMVCHDRFNTLKSNEEELNRIFIDIYGLQDELTPEVEDKDVTVRLADKKRDIRSLISYAVGCMFGRYSLDVEGLAYAGGEWDASKYAAFPADRDNIIPICDDEYFDDDITGRFVKFIETVYGKETLDENLRFIADALGGSGQPRDVIRNYFLNDFYADHLKIYQKRPIYWLFDSGKKNGFKALIYMHRYQPDTIARMRTDYVHEQQARYRTAIADLGHRIENASTAERVKLNKLLIKLQGQADEIREYEEKIHHLADQMIHIDLDDGVKHNYEIFGDVLAKIK